MIYTKVEGVLSVLLGAPSPSFIYNYNRTSGTYSFAVSSGVVSTSSIDSISIAASISMPSM